MCIPEFNFISVPTPIIINGIPFDEELLDPLDLFNQDFEDFEDAHADIMELYLTDSDSFTDYDQFQYPDFDVVSESENDFSENDSDFQDLLFDYLLVEHDVLRTYDSASALVYSRWIYENMSDFPPELEDFVEIQLGIIIDIALQSA